MAIKWTGYTRIELGDGTAIGVNSEAPSSPSAHSEVVDAIIEAVGKIEGFDGETTPIPTPAVADAPAEGGNSKDAPIPTVRTTDEDPKPEQPACNPPAPLDESMQESKPKLLIDIAKSTDSSEGAMKVISLGFRHLYEVFDRDEKRAMAFVECIASTKFDNVLVIPMSNDQVIMAEALACCPVGHDKLVELAKQTVARVAAAAAVDCVVNVR